MNKFDGATKTVGGHEVKDLKFNTAVGMYLGMVADPQWATPDRPFTSGTWLKSGKCVNKLRPELDLERPKP